MLVTTPKELVPFGPRTISWRSLTPAPLKTTPIALPKRELKLDQNLEPNPNPNLKLEPMLDKTELRDEVSTRPLQSSQPSAEDMSFLPEVELAFYHPSFTWADTQPNG
jgi:hypothetical protein